MRWRSVATSARSALAPGFSPRRKEGRAIRARLAEPAALLLRLRLGFGVGTKADVLAYLLGIAGKAASIREISSACVYTVAAIRRASEDMAAAHLIQSISGSRTVYRADPAGWRRVLALKREPLWRSWHHRFAFAAAFLAWREAQSDKPLSGYAAAVKGRELIRRHHLAFAADVQSATSDPAGITDGLGFFQDVVRSLVNTMRADA